VAVRQIGVPYRYGGSTVNGFDCSGLAQYAYAHAGKKIPRTTAQQWQRLSPIDRKHLAVGDLLFFRIDGKISHVGMYLGDDRFVHAPSSGREVSVASLNSAFYKRAFVRGGRP
jgi:cell wall-associated NlpC family hydrolase